ncbi:hypothetical protein [Flexivirga sp. B27]
MTTPPDDFEDDPTGMRDLLRSLPDPGPMPQDVSDRITAALAEEQTKRSTDDHSNVTPLTRTGRTTSRPGPGRRAMQAVGGLVAAAAVAAVAVVGVNSLQDDKVPASAVPSGGSHHSESSAELAERVQLDSTGTRYTKASFNTQAASMAAGTNRGHIPAQDLLSQFGSLTKPSAIISCVRSVGGSLLDNPSSIKVDFATYDNKPALVVVVTKGSHKTAFAVSTSCSKDSTPYAAPRSV